jgi:uncharacterized membrane protein YgcG
MSTRIPTGGEGLVAILVSACESLGRPQTDADCIAVALDTLGYDTVEMFSTWGNGALGRAELEPADVQRLGDELVAVVSPMPVVDGLIYRAIMTGICRKMHEHLRKEGAAAKDKAAVEDEDATTMSAYADYERRQGRPVVMDRMLSFAGAARKSIEANGYVSQLPALEKMQYMGCRDRRSIQKLGKVVLAEEESLQTASVATLEECKKVAADACRALAAAGSIEIRQDAYGSSEAGWVAIPGQAHEGRLWVTARATDRLIEAFSGSTITDPTAYASMFRVVMNKFMNESQRKLKHADDIIDKMVDTEVELFSKPGKTMSAAPPAAAAAVEAAPTAAAAPVKGHDGGACLSWLSNGICKKHDAGECMHSHPEGRRGNWMSGRGQKRTRPGGGGGNRSGGGGGGSSSWNGPWDGGWGPQWGPPGWGGNSGWGGNGGQNGKGGKSRGKGGGKGGWW